MPTSEETAVYLNDYTDTTEVLPLELQRNFTLIRQLDEGAQDLMEKVAEKSLRLAEAKTVLLPEERQEQLVVIGRLLNEALKKGEEKFALAKSIYDTVDRHCTRLDNDLQKFENGKYGGSGRSIEQQTPTRAQTEEISIEPEKEIYKEQIITAEKKGKKGKKRKTVEKEVEQVVEPQGNYLSTEDAKNHAEAVISMSHLPIDPNEPLYCYCQQVSFGEMVACDNEECDIEWFHIECVGLKVPPKGKWYCKNCGSDTKKPRRLL
ncbi:hypothetical protein J3Q64DRAFT_1715113 [Phycomyces blakesleeanus]|uniref:Chromatin modification-related protein n=1 Tax=Phycomyces blakesleeanus TaxID=4837 RepID=A0ABR3BHF3_PHYBL